MERMRFTALRSLSARVECARLRAWRVVIRIRVRPEARKKYVNYLDGGLVSEWGDSGGAEGRGDGGM